MSPVKAKLKGKSVRQFLRKQLQEADIAELHKKTGIPLGSLYRLREDGEDAFRSFDYMQALYECLTNKTIKVD